MASHPPTKLRKLSARDLKKPIEDALADHRFDVEPLKSKILRGKIAEEAAVAVVNHLEANSAAAKAEARKK